MKQSSIATIQAYEIISSGGTPSLECEVVLKNGISGLASVPFGASAGSKEAFILFDEDKNRYSGKGMLKAINNVNEIIAQKLIGQDALEQKIIDKTMIDLDGTENKQNLGANALLSVSMACARAAARYSQKELFDYLRCLIPSPKLVKADYEIPHPMMVVIEGGKHADNSTDLQEYLFSIVSDLPTREQVRIGLEAYAHLKKVLQRHNLSTNVGNEGAFAPSGINNNATPLELMREAVQESGWELGQDIKFSIDAAASEFFKNGKYRLDIEGKTLTNKELIKYFSLWLQKYPFESFEDMLDENDWEAWPELTKLCSKHNCTNIGDDLTVTNPKILKKAIETKSITGILVKLNQIGTVSETLETCNLATENNIKIIPSHRGGGETDDTFMVDLAVAVNAKYIKVGPTRGERVCKYNRLMAIARKLKK